MKVELNELRLGISALTEEVQVGVIDKKDSMSWLHKKNIHNDFLHAVITCWKNKIQVVKNGEGAFEITVKEIK